MSIEDNVKTRKAAEEAFSLMMESLREAALPEGCIRAAWEFTADMIEDTLGYRKNPVLPVNDTATPMTDEEAKRFAGTKMPFTKEHKGKRIDQVPFSLLEWCDRPDEFRMELKRYLKSDYVKRERDQSE